MSGPACSFCGKPPATRHSSAIRAWKAQPNTPPRGLNAGWIIYRPDCDWCEPAKRNWSEAGIGTRTNQATTLHAEVNGDRRTANLYRNRAGSLSRYLSRAHGPSLPPGWGRFLEAIRRRELGHLVRIDGVQGHVSLAPDGKAIPVAAANSPRAPPTRTLSFANCSTSLIRGCTLRRIPRRLRSLVWFVTRTEGCIARGDAFHLVGAIVAPHIAEIAVRIAIVRTQDD
jgi:hypothetical protein